MHNSSNCFLGKYYLLTKRPRRRNSCFQSVGRQQKKRHFFDMLTGKNHRFCINRRIPAASPSAVSSYMGNTLPRSQWVCDQ